MKFVVIGGTGLIGSKVVAKLTERGYEAIAASPRTGVNTVTGEGLAEVLSGAAVVVDVSNSPSFEDQAALAFFQTSTTNLLAAEATAGVRHHVALSVVGTERLSQSGYFRAKLVQEKLIKASSIPYSIVHATQFFEFVKGIADISTDGNTVRLAPVLIQPMAAEDVADAVARVAAGPPLNGTVEVSGPEQFCLDELIRRALSARHDQREVIADPQARYAGALLDERTLVPGPDARLGKTRFEDWLSRAAGPIPDSKAQPAVGAGAPPAPSALRDHEFRVSDVPPGSALLVGDVAVFNVDGRFCATQSRCTHKQGLLSKGQLDGSTVTCPLHGARFNVCTGAVLRGPATEPLKTYHVIVEGTIGRVEVGVLV
jgi:uncharacterized protein YbjT (DUF2867 family)/nitrite reductase/ring-hydroxylating ferredoxin subunit